MMYKSLILDFNLLKKQQITVEEFLKLVSIKRKIDFHLVEDTIDLEKLEELLFIKIVDNKIYLREKARELIDFLTIDTSLDLKQEKKKITLSKRAIREIVNERIDEFRLLWKGKAGAMGSAKACKEKLTRWMVENPDYSFEDIIKAAKLYLNTDGRNPRYLQRADYFIFKKEGREESSRLSAFIEDIDTEIIEDWTSELN